MGAGRSLDRSGPGFYDAASLLSALRAANGGDRDSKDCYQEARAPTTTAHIALERFRSSGRTVDARVALSAGIEVLMRPWSTDLTGARFSLCLQWAGMLWTARK